MSAYGTRFEYNNIEGFKRLLKKYTSQFIYVQLSFAFLNLPTFKKDAVFLEIWNLFSLVWRLSSACAT